MDLQMPVMDGLEATATIRKLAEPSKANVPIIALTAHAMRGDEERCLAAGMDAYISKPVNVADLFAVLERSAESPGSPSSGKRRRNPSSHLDYQQSADGRAGTMFDLETAGLRSPMPAL